MRRPHLVSSVDEHAWWFATTARRCWWLGRLVLYAPLVWVFRRGLQPFVVVAVLLLLENLWIGASIERDRRGGGRA